jgi:prolyl-tRNA synthetase
MILRMSTMFLRTLREDPADAEVPSHRLLVRAGYIRRTAPGVYSWLPLGWRTYSKIERIVREEMDAMGGQEIHLPALLPREPFEKSGRWVEYGDDIFRLKDRKGNDMLLGPTHEEFFTLLVKDLCSSYRDLPLILYQIQWKFRDEPRPRAGLLRGREFSMKDSYSFDLDDDGLARSYAAHRKTYMRIFDRLGLRYVVVHAHSGAMGGSNSEEFLSPAAVGEDTYVICGACDYASNVEAVEAPKQPTPDDGNGSAAHVEETPDATTIESLVGFLNRHFPRADRPWHAGDTLKSLAYEVITPTGQTSTVVVGLPGDRELDEKRLGAQLYPSSFRALSEEEFEKHPTLIKGYAGPFTESGDAGFTYLVDPTIVDGSRWVAGANQPGRHVLDLVVGRDFTPDGTILAAEVREGDPCPRCGSRLSLERGIELGHVFALGRKFANALDLQVLTETGVRASVTMGSYGIGVSRLVAVIAENNHDEKGLIWPREVAPADVHIVSTGRTEEPYEAGERLAQELSTLGLTVLLDDRRGASPGEKFNDAELIGVPTIAVCGRLVADGRIELRDRRSGQRFDAALAEAAGAIVTAVRT